MSFLDGFDLLLILDHHIDLVVQSSVNLETIWLCCCGLLLASSALDFLLVSGAVNFISYILPKIGG